MSELFKDIIPAILQTKKDVLDNERDYVPFVVNKALSFHRDCVLFANEMNKYPGLDRKLQFDFLLHSIKGYKRPYQKWQKLEDDPDLEAIKEFYGYSTEKAKEAKVLLSVEQIDEIKKKLQKGGLNANRKGEKM